MPPARPPCCCSPPGQRGRSGRGFHPWPPVPAEASTDDGGTEIYLESDIHVVQAVSASINSRLAASMHLRLVCTTSQSASKEQQVRVATQAEVKQSHAVSKRDCHTRVCPPPCFRLRTGLAAGCSSAAASLCTSDASDPSQLSYMSVYTCRTRHHQGARRRMHVTWQKKIGHLPPAARECRQIISTGCNAVCVHIGTGSLIALLLTTAYVRCTRQEKGGGWSEGSHGTINDISYIACFAAKGVACISPAIARVLISRVTAAAKRWVISAVSPRTNGGVMMQLLS